MISRRSPGEESAGWQNKLKWKNKQKRIFVIIYISNPDYPTICASQYQSREYAAQISLKYSVIIREWIHNLEWENLTPMRNECANFIIFVAQGFEP